jgi:hypothetical protein
MNTMFPRRNVHKTLGLLLVGKHNQIDHVLIDKRRYSDVAGGADCDTDHYMVVAELG